MTYFFDNNMSTKIVKILKIMGEDVCHLQDEFASDTPDEDWIPVVGEKGWTVVSCDDRIYKNGPQRAILLQSGVTIVWLPGSYKHKTLWEQAFWILKHWPAIRQDVEKEQKWPLLKANENGRIERLPMKK